MRFALLPLLLILPSATRANVEIHISHSVVRKLLQQAAFSEEGRMYVRNSKTARCSYAYLENPEISAEGGRLKIRARFTGRSARDLFGRCVGLGDSFLAVIVATPYYQDGAIRLKDVQVRSEGADGFYIRHVRARMAEELPKKFSYKLEDDARRLFEERSAKQPFEKKLERFAVSQVRVTDDNIVLAVDFVLSVK